MLATGLAVTAANALLIVPESSTNSEIVNTLPFEAQAESQSRSLNLACPECPLVTSSPDGRTVVTTDIPNHLRLSFDVDQSGPTDRLLLNGFELFPHPVWDGPLKAAQFPDGSDADASVPDAIIRDLGYSFVVRPVGGAEDNSAELLEVSVRIVELGDVVVEKVPTVVAHVIKLVDGTLMIADVDTQHLPALPSPGPSQCSTTFCRLRELISQHLAAFGSKIRQHCGGGKSPRPHHRPANPHGPKGYARKHHSWRHLLRKVFTHIVVPVLIGVVAGISASIIGMIVGTFAICLWRVVVLKRAAFPRRLCRHGCRRAAHRDAEAAVPAAATDDEKAGLVAHEEQLPPPPAYTDEDSTPSEQDKSQTTSV
jgi:hypothetical protein